MSHHYVIIDKFTRLVENSKKKISSNSRNDPGVWLWCDITEVKQKIYDRRQNYRFPSLEDKKQQAYYKIFD